MTLHIPVPMTLIQMQSDHVGTALKLLSTLLTALTECQAATMREAQRYLWEVQNSLTMIAEPNVPEEEDDRFQPSVVEEEPTNVTQRVRQGPDLARGRPRSPPRPTQPLWPERTPTNVREVIVGRSLEEDP